MDGSGRGKWIARLITLGLLLIPFAPIPTNPLETIAIEASSAPSDLTVSPQGPFFKIADAIEKAGSGSTIAIQPGIYRENLVIDKRVTLKGKSSKDCVIDGSGHNSTVEITADGVRLLDLSIRNSGLNETHDRGVGYDAGVRIKARSIDIERCAFSKNPRVSIQFIEGGDYTTIRDCYFSGPSMNHIRVSSRTLNMLTVSCCKFVNSAYQIVFYQPYSVSGISILDNTFVTDENRTSISDGISFSFWDHEDRLKDSEISGNIIKNAVKGLLVYAGSNVTVSYNEFEGCSDHGLIVANSHDVRVHHNNFIGCNGTDSQATNAPPKVQWTDTEGSGNYWSDYLDRYPDASRTGECWSTAYSIEGDAGAFDTDPLVERAGKRPGSEYPPVLICAGSSFEARCGKPFSIPLDIYDPDTPLSGISGSIVSGPSWVAFSDGRLVGDVPRDAPIRSYVTEVGLSDGKMACKGKVSITVIPGENIIGKWSMDLDPGRKLMDSGPYGWNGTLAQNATFVQGVNGTGVWLDGAMDSIIFPARNGWSVQGDYTISFLAYPMTSSGITEDVIWMGGKQYASVDWSLSFNWEDNGSVSIASEASENTYLRSGGGVVTRDEWNHLALSYDGNKAILYVNGVMVLEEYRKVSIPYPMLMVLGVADDRTMGFMGVLDELIIWNYALAPEAVAGICNEDSAGVVGYEVPPSIAERVDRDRDRLPDTWEVSRIGSASAEAEGDPDSDGYTNLQEYQRGSDPKDIDDPFPGGDTDRDLMSDEWEIDQFGNILQTAQDDLDSDGSSNLEEYERGTDPVDPSDPGIDRDRDGMLDEWEETYFGDTDARPDRDHDGDGYNTSDEYTLGTNPIDPRDPGWKEGIDDDGLPNDWEYGFFEDLHEDPEDDPDGDRYSNLEEYEGGTDPTDRDEYPYVFPWGAIWALLGALVLSLILMAGAFFFFKKFLRERQM